MGFSKYTVRRLWGKDGPSVFAATMSSDRFVFLNSNMSFDDKETREDRWKSDRFAAIREIFEIFNTNCGKLIEPPKFEFRFLIPKILCY